MMEREKIHPVHLKGKWQTHKRIVIQEEVISQPIVKCERCEEQIATLMCEECGKMCVSCDGEGMCFQIQSYHSQKKRKPIFAYIPLLSATYSKILPLVVC